MNAVVDLFWFAVLAVACGVLTHKVLPWLVVRAGRGLGFRMEANPLTAKRVRRFQQIRRGYYAFLVITTAFVMSLFLELYVNNKPLYIRYGDTVRFPAVADWGNFCLAPYWALRERVTGRTDQFRTQLMAKDFGLPEDGGELKARKYASWIKDTANLEAEAAALEADIAKDERRFRKVLVEQAANRGLVYDPASPLPDWKLEDYGKIRGQATRLRTLKTEFEQGKAGIVLALYPYSPLEQLLDLPGAPPHKPFLGRGFPVLGTDFEGKEVVAQLLYGFRVSFAFALIVTISGYFIGVGLGASMGFYGGWWDIGCQRFIEIWSNVPFLFVMMIIASVSRPDFWRFCLLMIVLASWEGITYTIRGEFYREKARDYVQAARALGVTDRKIMFRHILPNALVPIVTFAPFAIVGDMSVLVSLDFLGFGLPPGTPSWGALLRQGSENIVNHPQMVFIPVLAFASTLFCVVMVGEAVREAFDPKVYARLR